VVKVSSSEGGGAGSTAILLGFEGDFSAALKKIPS
jgi:hypothetical protein